MAACGRLSTAAAAADREALGGGITELGREGPEVVEVVVRVPSDGMGLFKGVARRWSGRGGSVPAGEHRGAQLMALRPLARVVTWRAGGEDDGTAQAHMGKGAGGCACRRAVREQRGSGGEAAPLCWTAGGAVSTGRWDGSGRRRVARRASRHVERVGAAGSACACGVWGSWRAQAESRKKKEERRREKKKIRKRKRGK